MPRNERTGCRASTRDNGSSLIEQLIAMSLIMTVLLGLLAALGATATSVSTGRQRTVAVSLAKQAIENLQGAAYIDVATNLSSPGLASDPLVSGTMPNLVFDGEPLVAGSSTPYLTTEVEAGTTFSLRTFVTAVTPASGAGPYRRITVIIDWNTASTPSASGQRTMRFSSLVFPLDYTSYPASSGSAEAIGGALTVTGTLAGENFDELHLALPGTHATTDSSTLRTSIGSAASSTSTVSLHPGAVTSTCPVYSDGSGECPRETAASVADNDTGTNTGESAVAVSQPFSAASISTPKGTTVLTPAGTMTSRATVAACGGCGFGDADELPWSEASLDTTSVASSTFQVDDSFRGTLWELAGLWSPAVKVDHDADGGGIVVASAQLSTPAARVFDLEPGTGPAGFAGAVRVSGFTASAAVAGGYTTVAPTVNASATTVEIWDDTLLPAPGYRTVTVTPGTSADITATASFAMGTHSVALTSRVQSQPKTTSTSGTSPRSHGAAQLPSLLLVTVVVEVTTGTAPVETFTIVFDYGRVSAGATWLVEPT